MSDIAFSINEKECKFCNKKSITTDGNGECADCYNDSVYLRVDGKPVRFSTKELLKNKESVELISSYLDYCDVKALDGNALTIKNHVRALLQESVKSET